MTGLSLADDALIEIAVIVTDSQLHALDAGIDIIITPPEAAVEQMGDFVREMHTTSGLLEDLPHGTTLADAQAQVLEYIKRFVPEAGKAPLAGNSVGTDKSFLDRDMPGLIGHLHYRIRDVSSIEELARRRYPRAYFNAPGMRGGDRARADSAESIDELRYDRSVLGPEDEGPSSAVAKEKAQLISASPTLAATSEAQDTTAKAQAAEDV